MMGFGRFFRHRLKKEIVVSFGRGVSEIAKVVLCWTLIGFFRHRLQKIVVLFGRGVSEIAKVVLWCLCLTLCLRMPAFLQSY